MKKGQITVFLILALILLLAVAIFIFLREKEIIFQPEIIDPPEIEPITNYIEQCVLDISIEAIQKMGLQGGYLNVPDIILSDPNAFIDYGYGLYAVPFWYYSGEMRVPTLDFMSAELATYIEQNLPDCTNDFEAFKDQFEIESKDPKVEILFRDTDLMVMIEYPIRIQDLYDYKATKLSEFTVVVPVNLKSAHDLASKIMAKQHEKYLFENITLDIMAANSGEFPFTGMEMQCDSLGWTVPQIKKRLQEVMVANLPRVRVKNTDYPPFEREEAFYEQYAKYTFLEMMEKLYEDYPDGYFPDDSEFALDITNEVSDSYEYFKLFLDVDSEAPNMRTSFMHFPEWDMEMVIHPTDGERLIPRESPGGGVLSFMCIQVYHYTYNIRYPIMVRIWDPYAFMGRGFTFQFAFPVLIMQNQGVHDVFRVANFDSFRTVYDFCDPNESYGDIVYKIKAKGVDEDGYTGQALNGVNISYQCLNRRCDGIGMTEFKGTLETNLPEGCTGARVYGEKEGYLEGMAVVTGEDVEIQMEKLRKFEVEIQRVPYFALTGTFGSAEELADDEVATFYIELIDYGYTQSFSTDEMIPSEPLYLREEGGRYRIDAIISRGEDITGAYFVKNLEISPSDFTGSTKVTLPIIVYRPEPVGDTEEMEMMAYLLGGAYNESVRPTFS